MYLTKSNFTFSCSAPMKRYGRTMKKLMLRYLVMVAVVLVLIGSIARGTGLQRPIIRQGTAGDHQPLLGSGPFVSNPRLHPAFDHLDGHGTFLAASHHEPPPGRWMEGFAPIRDRLPRGFRSPSTTRVLRPWHVQVAHHGGAGHPQHIALAPFSQLMAKPRVATELIIAGDPSMRHLLTPRVEHLQALLLARVIAHHQWYVACVAPLLVVH